MSKVGAKVHSEVHAETKLLIEYAGGVVSKEDSTKTSSRCVVKDVNSILSQTESDNRDNVSLNQSE